VSFFGERVTLRRVRFFGGRCGWDFGGDCMTGNATLSSLDSPMYIRELSQRRIGSFHYNT